MTYKDLTNLKEDCTVAVEAMKMTFLKNEDGLKGMMFVIRTNIIKSMAINFLERHNILNSTNEEALIEYLSEDSDFVNNTLHKLIIKTYE